MVNITMTLTGLLRLLGWTQVLYNGWKERERVVSLLRDSNVVIATTKPSNGSEIVAPFAVVEWQPGDSLPFALLEQRPPYSVLVLTNNLIKLNDLIASSKISAGFYAASHLKRKENVLNDISRVLALRGRSPVVQILKSTDVRIPWELQGMPVTSISLTWEVSSS